MPQPTTIGVRQGGGAKGSQRTPAGGKGLSKPVGGFPLYVWGIGLLLAIGVGLYIRKRSASTSAAQNPTATTPAASGGGASSGAGFDPYQFIADSGAATADAINGLSSLISAGSFSTATDTSSSGAPIATAAPETATPNPSPLVAATAQDTMPSSPFVARAASSPSPTASYVASSSYVDSVGAVVASPGAGTRGSFDRTLTDVSSAPPPYAGGGIPAHVSGTFAMPPTVVTPGEVVTIDPYNGPSYIFPGSSTDLHVATPEAQAKGQMGSYQAI